MERSYNPSEIESKWQKFWEDNKTYQTTRIANRKKKYVLDMFPYPSGAGLHVGHTLGFIATDIYSRYLRMIGYNVLHPMGWDAFGLPAENYAINTGVHPRLTTQKNIANFRRQLKSLGLSYDWGKEVNTSDPEYYKWTQWLFLKLYEKGLAYRKNAFVNWCGSCQTVLANEQIKEGKCERCKNDVVQKNMEQWFFRITQYAEDLLSDLENLDWPEPIKTMQRNWIGKSEGATIKFKVKSKKSKVEDIDVFTTRPDTLFGATYLVIAPDHQKISNLKSQISNWNEVEEYIIRTKKKSDLQRTDLNKEKTGVEIKGVVAINPVNNSEIPIWIADYVLSGYGTGAIMAVPAHDERDFEFAKKYNIKIITVIENSDIPYVGQGKLINSGEFNGLSSSDSKDKITIFVGGKLTVSYKLRDWLISRQRYWGAPIPIIYCKTCGTVPVPEDQLPVELPTDVDFKPTGESPLVHSKLFHSVKCPKCQSSARRESDTLDTFVDSSWYYLRFIDPKNSKEFCSKELLKLWTSVDMYVGGAEHAVMHLLYARFIAKALRDIGLINFDEPFISLRNQGLIIAEDGRKMSKSLGNVINPDDVVEKYGADTFRVYEMFMGPLEDSKPWSTRNIIGSYRFLENIWKFGIDPTFSDKEDKIDFEKLKIKVTHDIESLGFNTAIAELMKFIKITKLKITKNTWKDFLILISPFVPHLAEELWKRSHFEGLISDHSWVKIDKNILGSKYINIPVQINNKVRAVIKISKRANLADIKSVILQDSKVSSRILDKKYKLIYIPLKIISIVVYN